MRICFESPDETPPVDEVETDAVPRVGDRLRFYNIGPDHVIWKVIETYWMVGAYRATAPYDAVATVCVVIQRLD